MTTYTLNTHRDIVATLVTMNKNDTIEIINEKTDYRTTYYKAWLQELIGWRLDTNNTLTVEVPVWFEQYKGDKYQLLVDILNEELERETRGVKDVINDLLIKNTVSYAPRPTIWYIEDGHNHVQ